MDPRDATFTGISVPMLVYSFNRHLMKAHFGTGSTLAAGDVIASKADIVPEQRMWI